jgi:tRNA threonylcarbamoyladenosine biosynthesis protein TsaB
MLILAIETATERASVALVDDGRERAAWHDETAEGLCRCLAAEVGGVVARGKANFSQLDLVVAGLGPGSFTSLRIGLATAKAIALAYDLPLVGVSSLAAMAWQVRGEIGGLLCPALDARRGDLYAAVYRAAGDGLDRLVAEFVGKPELVAATLKQQGAPACVFGLLPATAVEQIEQAAGDGITITRGPILPDAGSAAAIGGRRFQCGGADDLASLRPIYVRKSYAEEASGLDLGLR